MSSHRVRLDYILSHTWKGIFCKREAVDSRKHTGPCKRWQEHWGTEVGMLSPPWLYKLARTLRQSHLENDARQSGPGQWCWMNTLHLKSLKQKRVVREEGEKSSRRKKFYPHTGDFLWVSWLFFVHQHQNRSFSPILARSWTADLQIN